MHFSQKNVKRYQVEYVHNQTGQKSSLSVFARTQDEAVAIAAGDLGQAYTLLNTYPQT